jgi:hypothetical protein
VSSRVPAHLHLAVALDGAGWHPAAWREADARPLELFSPRYWVDLVRESEWSLLDEFADTVVPIMQERDRFRTDYDGPTLRDHLGLPAARSSRRPTLIGTTCA